MLQAASYKLQTRHIVYIATALLGVSFLAYFYSWVNTGAFIGFGLLMLILGLWKREYMLYLAFLELMLGSFGYLLYLPFGGLNLSLRMVFFLIIMALYVCDLICSKINIKYSIFNISLAVFAIVFLTGVLRGYLSGHGLSNVFFDANSYVCLLLFLPALKYINTKEKLDELLKVVLAGTAILAAETFGIFIIFAKSQNLGLLEIIYKWVRDFRIGEITSLKNGAYRIFMQSQIYLLAGFLILAARYISGKTKTIWSALSGALFGGAIYISLSRSLWIGFAFGLACIFFVLIYLKFSYKKIIVTYSIIAAVIFFGVFFANLFIPKDASLLANRLKIGESALNTRIEQLKPLIPAIINSPIFGYGFGKTLTFKSLDPRVTYVMKDGSYATYAFEWGYLDMVLKFGILGLLAYLYFIWNIIGNLLKKIKEPQSVWALAILVALLAIHIFTPYLNHPLGIGILILAGTAAAIDKNEKMS